MVDETIRTETLFANFVMEHIALGQWRVKILTNVENNGHTSETLLRSEFGVGKSKCPIKFISCGS